MLFDVILMELIRECDGLVKIAMNGADVSTVLVIVIARTTVPDADLVKSSRKTGRVEAAVNDICRDKSNCQPGFAASKATLCFNWYIDVKGGFMR